MDPITQALILMIIGVFVNVIAVPVGVYAFGKKVDEIVTEKMKQLANVQKLEIESYKTEVFEALVDIKKKIIDIETTYGKRLDHVEAFIQGMRYKNQ